MVKKFSVLLLILLLVIGVTPIMSQPTFTNIQKQLQTEKTNVMELSRDFVEKQITGGQKHIYAINLSHGQFLFLDVQQLGIDLTIQLIDVNGSVLIQNNTPDLFFGQEPLYWVVEETGVYKITVKPTESSAKSGKYRIKLGELREKKPTDFHYIEAQKALAEAERLRFRGNQNDLEASIKYYSESIKHWKEVGRVDGEAICTNLMGSVNYYLNDTERALKYYEKALGIVSEPALKVDILTNAGIMNDILGNKKKAIEYLQEAISISKSINNRGVANIFNSLGILYSDSGNQEKALFFCNQALAASRDVGTRVDEGTALHNIALIFFKCGNKDKAIKFSKEALIIWEEIEDFRNRVYTLNQIAKFYMQSSNIDMALVLYKQVIDLFEGRGETREVEEKIIALSDIGYIWYLKKDYKEALHYLDKALNMAISLKNTIKELVVLHSQGLVYSAMGDQKKALEKYSRAYELSDSIKDKKFAADVLYSKALSYQKLNDLDLAFDNIRKVINLIESIGLDFSDQQLKIFYLASVNDYYKLYIDLLMQQHEKEPSKGYNIQALYIQELSQARTLVEFIQEAHINTREGVSKELINKERELVEKINKNTESLLKLISNPTYSINDKDELEKLVSELELELQQIQAKIRQVSPGYIAVQNNKTVNLEQIQKDFLDDETILLEYSIGKNSSYLWLISNKTITSYKLPGREEIGEAVDPVLTYYGTFFRPSDESETDRKHNTAKEELFVAAANNFSQMILGKVASQLGNKRLLIVPDGVLQYIPFSGLPDPTVKVVNNNFSPLVVNHEIVIIPSASAMASLRKLFAGRKAATKSIMVLADPIFSAADERLAINTKKKQLLEQKSEVSLSRAFYGDTALRRLVAAGEEAANIKDIYSNATIAVGTKASLSLATSPEVGEYRIIHYSTHGFLNPVQPELSGLVLSLFDDEGKEQSGYLTPNHIYNLKLNADLVVLSACQTGLGKQVKGEGILGLTRAFMFAGTKRIIFSLWNVNDKSTTDLMTKFYNAIKNDGLTPAAALRKAQIAMWKDKKWSSPYYWAAFQIQGEWGKN